MNIVHINWMQTPDGRKPIYITDTGLGLDRSEIIGTPFIGAGLEKDETTGRYKVVGEKTCHSCGIDNIGSE